MDAERFVARLASARIGSTYNFYREGRGAKLRRGRLAAYLDDKADTHVLLVGEAPGYRGARISGIPFTSERQLTGRGPAEASATIVHRVLGELGIEDEVLLWNVVPTHPHEPGSPYTNRRPSRFEVDVSFRYLEGAACGRPLIAVGRLAEEVTGAPYVRHPAHGGATAFRRDLETVLLRFRVGAHPRASF